MIVKPILHPAAFSPFHICGTHGYMPRKGRIYFREWRRSKGLTQAQAVSRIIEVAGDLTPEDPTKRVPKTEASLSRIESGKQPYTTAILEVLAEIYDTEPEHLIGRNPMKEGKLLSIIDRLTPEQYVQAEAILEALTRTAVNG